MAAHAKTVFEAEGRALKVAALIRAIDRELRGTGEPVGAQLIGDYLRTKDQKWWNTLARQHGIRRPSVLTQDAVIAEYEARAAEDAEAETEPDLSALYQEDYDASEREAHDERMREQEEW